jgi:peptidoglycan-associated lipoprotein
MIRILFTFSMVVTLMLSGCASGGKLASGEKLYQLGEYYKASSHFKKAYSHEKNRFYKARASFRLGMCYLKLNQGQRAVTALDRAVRNGYSEPEVYLHWGQALRITGKYEEAIDVYQKYLEFDVGNVVANNGISSCRLFLKDPEKTRYQVEEVSDLNSRYSDFSPTFEGTDFSTVYFSSMRKAGKKKKNTSRITGQGSSMVYSTRELGGGQWEDPEPFTGDVSVNDEDGTPCFSADGKELYFTRCSYLEDGPSGAAIWNK